MCGKSLRKVASIDCKIIEYNMNEKTFLRICKLGLRNFTPSLLKSFADYKVEAFNFV